MCLSEKRAHEGVLELILKYLPSIGKILPHLCIYCKLIVVEILTYYGRNLEKVLLVSFYYEFCISRYFSVSYHTIYTLF